MNTQLTLWPYLPGSNTYGAAQTKSIAAWGFKDNFTGNKRANLFASTLDLTAPGAALTDTPFTYRSRIALVVDGVVLFAGQVADDPRRSADGHTDEAVIHCEDALWALDKIVFRQTVQILMGVNLGPPVAPVYMPNYFTHFTLNLQPTPDFQSGLVNSVSYGVVALDSRAQIGQALDYARANGVWIDYIPADLLSVPVRPTNVQNITCLGAIRMQLEDVNCVCWLDYSPVAGGGAPRLHCARRKDLAAISRALCSGGTPDLTRHAQAFSLERKSSMSVAFVQLDFEQQRTVNGVGTLVVQSAFFPNPRPGDQFNALITSVPLTPMTGTTHEKFIQTDVVAPNDLSWWQRRLPAMDPAANSNFAVEYDGLAFAPGTEPTRQTTLPNMIIGGGIADWMGGLTAKDKISAQFTYHRKARNKLQGALVAAHTKTVRVDATNLNFPDGQIFTWTDWTSTGEDITPYLVLPQIIFEDLNPPTGHWAGTIPLIETVCSGTIDVGHNFNLLGSRPEHATMNELIQEIGYVVKNGAIFYKLTIGPNPAISPAKLVDRLRAERVRYVTAVRFAVTQPAATRITLTRQEGSESGDAALPQLTQDHITDGTGGVLQSVQNGNPILTLQTYDATGAPQTPTSPTPGGQVVMDLSKCRGSDGKWHSLSLQERKVCDETTGKTRTTIVLCCDNFQAPDDPP
ncbi:MAG: hypothetical protein KGJ13_07375 [Patescibacteria group bacterium]|nr:hypothetical protein [Patescibacteria group bacterium]